MNADIAQYGVTLGAVLDRIATLPAVAPRIAALKAAAAGLAGAADSPAAWPPAFAAWQTARNDLRDLLSAYLLDGLPDIPGLADLALRVGWESGEGLSGHVDLGPFRLGLASSALTVQPPDPPLLPPLVVGPYRPSAIEASVAVPGGAKAPGGGALVRTAHGFGGRIAVPLGIATVDAAALLEELPDGAPSLLAILGIVFTPPIQLSFGFSLDRVGGLIGVNRRVNADALAHAVRTGAAGNLLFAAEPPASPAALVADMAALFPATRGQHVLGPTLRISWLSIGDGSFLSLDLGVIVALPDVKIVILGVARAEIPKLASLLHLRLDLVGIIDPAQSQISLDASLVDSHALGVFTIFGDGAMRLNWGGHGHALMSVGGFYPGFNPEPARLPPLRRVGLDLDSPLPTFDMHAEGYFAVTTNSFQLGGRIEASISMGIGAHGFLQVDALVQFRPFHFVANCSAGFSVHAGGFHFGGVRLDGTISGPGPLTVRGRLTIETFLFDLSWDESFTFGDGQPDALTAHQSLLDTLLEEVGNPANVRAVAMEDPAVLLKPRPVRPGFAAIPPVGALRWSQRRAPLGLLIDRVDGMPLPGPQGAKMDMAGRPVTEVFAPGNFCTRTSSQALGQPAFDLLDAGIEPDLSGTQRSPAVPDGREVKLVVIRGGTPLSLEALRHDLSAVSSLVAASRKPAALSDARPLIVARREQWTHAGLGAGATYESATAAHQATRRWPGRSVALAKADAAAPVSLAGI